MDAVKAMKAGDAIAADSHLEMADVALLKAAEQLPKDAIAYTF